jgi:hypothetical protein
MNTCCVAKSTKAITYLLFRQRRSNAEGFAGLGVKPSPDCNTLAVEGCFWACETELVLFDFSNLGISFA